VNWVQQKKHSSNQKNVFSADKILRQQTLESLTPGILGPSSPTKLEKNNFHLDNLNIGE
jgi:hypothetical protein